MRQHSLTPRLEHYVNPPLPEIHGHQRKAVRDFIAALLVVRGGVAEMGKGGAIVRVLPDGGVHFIDKKLWVTTLVCQSLEVWFRSEGSAGRSEDCSQPQVV
jgi:hypothetical protein